MWYIRAMAENDNTNKWKWFFLMPMKTRRIFSILLLALSLSSALSQAVEPATVSVNRIGDRPIITSELDQRMGGNIQGPSLIKVPKWIENPIGRGTAPPYQYE